MSADIRAEVRIRRSASHRCAEAELSRNLAYSTGPLAICAGSLKSLTFG
jgi:hypothetical protein